MWNFEIRNPGIPRRDPTDKEYFTDEESGDLLKALVRESIQNSIDAKISGEQLSVRFFCGAINPQKDLHDRFLLDLIPHISSTKSGIKNSEYLNKPTVRFIAIEDFGTTGLEGDAFSDEEPDESVDNRFYYFWRHIGKGGKSGSELGRWGLGKTVFPAISEIGTFFGLTKRRSDSQQMLMGLSVLKHHHVKGIEHQPYGYFADTGSDKIPVPIDDNKIVDTFNSEFGLQRSDDSGLSTVVIAPSEEVTVDGLVKEVVEQFFFAIIMENLSVTVADESQEIVVDRTYILEHLEGIKVSNPGLAQNIELAIWYSDKPRTHIITDFNPDRGPSESLQETLNSLAEDFENFQAIAVDMPIEIFPKTGKDKMSSITLIGKKGFSSDRAYVSYIRQGLSIPGMRTLCPSGSRFIAYAHKPALAEFLGDAEDPAHRNWTATERVRDGYNKVPPTIDKVKQAVKKFNSLLLDTEDEVDNSLLRSFFPAPSDESKVRRPTRKKPPADDGDTTGAPITPVTRPMRRFTISQIQDGFQVSRGEVEAKLPESIEIKVAYDTVTGNPIKAYDRLDFELDKAPISIVSTNCKTRQKLGAMIIYNIKSDFQVIVTGFDSERDLITDGRLGT